MKTKKLYQTDKYLKNINTSRYSKIIINISNTLFFYKNATHSDIYYEVGVELCNNYGFNYAPKTFEKIRIEAEKKALCNNAKSLKEIYEYMPFTKDICNMAYELELKKEIDSVVVNDTVMEFINDNKDKIVLTSNMYFGMDEINYLIEDIFHSKKLYKLYKEFDKCLDILNKDVLYIDNALNNYKKIVVDKCDVIKYGNETNIFDKYSFEETILGSTVNEVRFLRELASYQSGSENSDLEAFFFEIGASYIAPVYALFSEWIIRFCKNNNIEYILPLMREGTVINMCLTRLFRDNSIKCVPLHVSRRALFNASITSDNFEQKIDSVLMKQKANPNILLSDIGLSLDDTQFIKYNKMKDLINDGKLNDLKDFIYNNKNVILDYSKNQRQLFLKMLSDIVGNKKCVTVDIGFSGTSEGYIRDLIEYEKSNINIEHIILMGSDGAQIKNLMNGLKIYTWLGMAGENTDITKKLMYQIQILEVLINDIRGTTMKYELNSNKAVPVLDTGLPKDICINNEKALACQRGIHAYITEWLKYRDSIDIDQLLEKKVGFINMWRKPIECPSIEEAYNLGNLMLYDNYTIEKNLFKVRNDYDKDIDDIGDFLQNVNKTVSEYPQAIVVCKYPYYFKERLLEEKLQIPGIKKMITVINELQNSDNGKIAIFAAGQRGRDFLKIAGLFGLNIECFIDSNSALHGTVIDGIPVISINNAKMIKYFINSSYNYPDEINNIILEHYKDKDIKIFTL